MMLPRLRSILVPALGLLTLTAAISACRPKITAPPEPPLAVRLGDDAFRLQDYEAAIDDYQVYIDSVEHGEYTPFVFYQTALSWYRLEQYEQCLDVLDELSRRYPDDHWVQADALEGDANYKLDRRAAALIAWDQGWTAAEPKERPEFRRRIVNALREMDEGELAEAREIVENPDVLALVEHQSAIAGRRGSSEPGSFEREPRLAKAAPADAVSTSDADETHSEAQLAKGTAPTGTSANAVADQADSVADQAGSVADQADEVARLSDEVDVTGDQVFEAIRDTEEAREQIHEVDESTATFAPLARVEIPEPPFVDRPVPEPRKVIRVAPADEPVAVAPAPPPQAIIEERVGVDAPRVPGESVALERVGSPAPDADAIHSDDAKVACVLPLTGADRAVGEAMLRGIRLVFGEGNPQVIFRDTGSDAEFARGLVAELGGDGDVLVAIAPAAGGQARSLASSAERASVPLLLVSSSTVPNTRYVRLVPPGRTSDELTERYREKYGSAPDSATAQAYEAARLAQQALQIAPVPRQDVLSRLAGAPDTRGDRRLGAAGGLTAQPASAS